MVSKLCTVFQYKYTVIIVFSSMKSRIMEIWKGIFFRGKLEIFMLMFRNYSYMAENILLGFIRFFSEIKIFLDDIGGSGG